MGGGASKQRRLKSTGTQRRLDVRDDEVDGEEVCGTRTMKVHNTRAWDDEEEDEEEEEEEEEDDDDEEVRDSQDGSNASGVSGASDAAEAELSGRSDAEDEDAEEEYGDDEDTVAGGAAMLETRAGPVSGMKVSSGHSRTSMGGSNLFVQTPEDYHYAWVLQRWLKGHLARKYLSARGFHPGGSVNVCACAEDAKAGAEPVLPPEGTTAVPTILCPAEGLGGRLSIASRKRQQAGLAHGSLEGVRRSRSRAEGGKGGPPSPAPPSSPPPERRRERTTASSFGGGSFDWSNMRQLNFSSRCDTWGTAASGVSSPDEPGSPFGRAATLIPRPSPGAALAPSSP